MLEQSREVDPDGQKGQEHSSDEEGWGENDVAPGQLLSDYRPLNHLLVPNEVAQGISEAGLWVWQCIFIVCSVTVDTGVGHINSCPIQSSLAKAKAKDIPGINGVTLSFL